MLASASAFRAIRSAVNDGLQPVRSSGASLSAPLGALYAQVDSPKDQSKELARLRKELDAAKASSLRYRDALRERNELLALNNLANVEKLKSVSARVVVARRGNFDETIEIDRGSDSGIRVNNVVVTGSGLVGKVTSVGSNHSVVTLVTDASSTVGVRLSVSGDVGLARGEKAGKPLRINLVGLDTPVAINEILVTSGLQNSEFPPSIPVAMVVKVQKGVIEQDVTAVPVVDLRHLSFVKVLLSSGPQNELRRDWLSRSTCCACRDHDACCARGVSDAPVGT